MPPPDGDLNRVHSVAVVTEHLPVAPMKDKILPASLLPDTALEGNEGSEARTGHH